MSVYGNKLINDKSINELYADYKALCIEMKSINEFVDILNESNDNILYEFDLSIFKKKLSKNDSLLSKMKKKLKEIKLVSSTSLNKFLTPEDREKYGVIDLGPLYNYNDAIKKATKFYKEYNNELKSIERELNQALSRSDINKIKDIRKKMEKVDVRYIDVDPKKMGKTKFELILPDGGTNYDLQNHYNLTSILTKLVSDVNPIIKDALKEVQNTLDICLRMNNTLHKYYDKIDKTSNNDELKNLIGDLGAITNEFYRYTSHSAGILSVCESAGYQRDRLTKAYNL